MATTWEASVGTSRSGQTGPRIRTVAAWLLPAAVLAVVVGVLAALGQHAHAVAMAAAGLDDDGDYPLVRHVLAMVVLGALSVAVASVLARAGNLVATGAVLLGAAFGPMTLVAAPIAGGLVRSDSFDTVPWWHGVVGLAVTACLIAWTAAVLGVSAASPEPLREVPQAGIFTLGAAVAFLVCLTHPQTWSGSGPVGVAPTAGWALMTGGLFLAAALSTLRSAILRLALTAAALGAMFVAYDRDGGWPGVAGWEYLGMESPLVLSASIVAVLLLATPAGSLTEAIGARLNGSTWQRIYTRGA